jgi:hypothetical protein
MQAINFSVSKLITSKLYVYVINFTTDNLSYVSVLFCIDTYLVFVGVLDIGVSRSTCSWATSMAQLQPGSKSKTEAQQGRPS